MGLSVNVLAADVKLLDFTRSSYDKITAINPATTDFADTALTQLKAIFNFNEFCLRTMQDINKKMSEAEYAQAQALFENVFFLNFKKNALSINNKKINTPVYSVTSSVQDYQVVTLSGTTAAGSMHIDFYIKSDSRDSLGIIDLAIDGVQLSRNYRGVFNRLYREKGFAGLSERLQNKQLELTTK